ncbi:FecR domain-containing protein [Paenibacillus sonchi]|uniref:FecR domain-containing protein n=1 Tax=Paenibacillus sonchi TaxID=373687 RepID=A0A974PI55_9BACL|nr:FecR domain-containing protein [Paenibacillus sonchi]QQZ63652.1 FecR domain-containing protein [Paenibacillus sonchi]
MSRTFCRLILLFSFVALLTCSFNIKIVAAEKGAAYIDEVSGEVTVKLAGGIKTVAAFANMPLSQGDQILTGHNASAIVRVAKPESVNTIGPDSRVSIAKLARKTAGSKFSLKLWTGSMWNSVNALSAGDEAVVETPGARLNVRGTNFLVRVQADGTLSVFAASGLVEADLTTKSSSGDASILVAPTQQLNVFPANLPRELHNALTIVDVEELVKQSNPFILKAIIASTSAIITENNAFIQSLQKDLNTNTQPVIERGGVESDIYIRSQQELQAYAANLNNFISNVAYEAVRASKLDSAELTRLITEINRQIADSSQTVRLSGVDPINPLAGVNPTSAPGKEQERIRLEAVRKEIEQKQQLLQNDFKANVSLTLQQLTDLRNELAAANQSILEKLQEDAEKRYTAQLSPEELAVYKKNKQELAAGHLDPAAKPAVPASVTPDSSSDDPGITLVQTKTETGFNLSIHLKQFTGSSALYAAEFHFISDNSLVAGGSGARLLNNSYFPPANSTDVLKTITGTMGNAPVVKTETIYAATQFGAASDVAISDGVLATIPFKVTGSGTLKLFYVKIVDSTGKVILELTDAAAGLPPVIVYSK